MPTCEGCNRTDGAMVTNELCSECSDKAARFDIVLIERNNLFEAVKDALRDLEQAGDTRDKSLRLTFLSQAVGRLRVAKNYCES